MAGVDGLVSGIDTGAIVSGLMAAARRPIARLQAQFDELSAQRAAMQQFNGLLSSLQSAVEALDTSTEMTAYQLSTSQPSALGVTASGSPSLGEYNVEVVSLAQGSVDRSQGFSTATDQLREGSIDLTIDGVVTNVLIDDATGTRSIQDLSDYINANVSGARAYVLDTGSGATPYRLIIEAEETGTNNAVTTQVNVTGAIGTVLSMTQIQTAADAELTVAGTTVYSQSNQPVDVIPGLTFDLSAVTTGTARIKVGRDSQQTADNVQGVVDAYNAVMEFISAQTGSSASPGGPLAGDSTMRAVSRRIQSVLNTATGSGNITGLDAIGLGSTQTGTLAFDAAEFKTALAANPGDVIATITGASGLFGELASELDIIGDPITGFIKPRLDGFDSRMGDLTARVEAQEERMDAYETGIREQFVAMELVLARYQSTGNFLEQQIAQWNKS